MEKRGILAHNRTGLGKAGGHVKGIKAPVSSRRLSFCEQEEKNKKGQC